MVTQEHLRVAIDICAAGGTPDHPYEQSRWGDDQCGTACCIYGHACLVAGEPVGEPPDEWLEANPYWALALCQRHPSHAMPAAHELLDTDTMTPYLLAKCARNNPWAALRYAASLLPPELLFECAQLDPEFAIECAAHLLPTSVLVECARIRPWDALEYAAHLLPPAVLYECAKVSPISAINHAARIMPKEMLEKLVREYPRSVLRYAAQALPADMRNELRAIAEQEIKKTKREKNAHNTTKNSVSNI